MWEVPSPPPPPKSAKRSTFSHKVDRKNGGFGRRLKGECSKSPLLGSKRSRFGGSRTLPPPPISWLRTSHANGLLPNTSYILTRLFPPQLSCYRPLIASSTEVRKSYLHSVQSAHWTQCNLLSFYSRPISVYIAFPVSQYLLNKRTMPQCSWIYGHWLYITGFPYYHIIVLFLQRVNKLISLAYQNEY